MYPIHVALVDCSELPLPKALKELASPSLDQL
jgi:hypothetical protein